MAFRLIFILKLTLLLSTNLFGQSCKDIAYDSIKVKGQIIKYKLFKSGSHFDQNKNKIYDGEIVLPNFTIDSDKSQLEDILNRIGIKHKIKEFTAFEDCDALNIYHSSLGINKGATRGRIGTFKLDW
ncbi:MAG: hypothetical protein J0L69_10775 [Bacteroidetes bacterium]|nr:hypothetical protein [Bacteroidota bacterium]